MWWILACIAFGLAAIIAIAAFPGVSLATIAGIIAIGGFFLALEVGDWRPWPRSPRP
jgi:hypothetical protein